MMGYISTTPNTRTGLIGRNKADIALPSVDPSYGRDSTSTATR